MVLSRNFILTFAHRNNKHRGRKSQKHSKLQNNHTRKRKELNTMATSSPRTGVGIGGISYSIGRGWPGVCCIIDAPRLSIVIKQTER